MKKNYGVRLQIERLGLEKFVAEAPKEFRILDVGCGTEASLVRHLQQEGYKAEGIDDTGPNSYPGVVNQIVTARWPEKGSIPIESGAYHVVTSHQNSLINTYASAIRETRFLKEYVLRGEDFDKVMAEDDQNTRILLSEMLRVLRPDGAIILYPAADRITQIFGELFGRELHISQKYVKGVPREDGIICVEPYPGHIIKDDCLFGIRHRTLIYNPKKVNAVLRAMLID